MYRKQIERPYSGIIGYVVFKKDLEVMLEYNETYGIWQPVGIDAFPYRHVIEAAKRALGPAL
ncbi:MAG TPA: hypothetical protein VHD69_01590 [Candidatus Paceibacterota bacterium]|nr:hypothetical protein [Candidatus Paceibacterota bacterium]